MSTFQVFLVSALVGAIAAIVYFAATGHARPRGRMKTDFKEVDKGIFITEQVKSYEFSKILTMEIKTIVDFRPDGEADDQIPSADIAKFSEANHIKFAYIPVPHGPIPDQSVVSLRQALQADPTPILMYCRSGNRAIRTYCLVEASRTGAPTFDALSRKSHALGFDIKDLQSEIEARIKKRESVPSSGSQQ